MKANSTHISLETAKLLKDCGIKSKFEHIQDEEGFFVRTYIPLFTWQEILWENSDKFFKDSLEEQCYDFIFPWSSGYILELLQLERYDEADSYFRENCILIKK